MRTHRTIPSVPPPPDLSKTEVKEEGNLLIEAVSLLVQRQRETESWVAEQVWQAEERAAAAEQRYAELEARLVGIEEHLARLVQDVEPRRGDTLVEERLARLREQVEGLKSVGDGLTARSGPAVAAPAPQPVAAHAREPEPTPAVEPRYAGGEPRYAVAAGEPRYEPRYEARAVGGSHAVAASPGRSVSFWELLGPSPQDRAGVILIGAGAVAVVYAILTQLRF
jgi:hypothetical protein